MVRTKAESQLRNAAATVTGYKLKKQNVVSKGFDIDYVLEYFSGRRAGERNKKIR